MLKTFGKKFVQIGRIESARTVGGPVWIGGPVGQLFGRCLLPSGKNDHQYKIISSSLLFPILEALLAGLLDVELLGECKIGVVDGGVRQ